MPEEPSCVQPWGGGKFAVVDVRMRPLKVFNSQAAAIAYAKMLVTMTHPRDCAKAPHDLKMVGYLHDVNDDGPYDVDGARYCGRCHFHF